MSNNAVRPTKRAQRVFNQDALKRICEMHETDFAAAYGMEVTVDDVRRKGEEYADFHAFKDNGSNILAVAHLDTVIDHKRRTANFVDTEDGLVVYSGALDDRLGAYTILEVLPQLGINVDVLLTTGEENGRSTGQYFDAPAGKEYLWMIEFDRGGTDVVMYQYDDKAIRALVADSGARPADGIFSDISYMEHLGIKGFNWGVGYKDYHGPRGHAHINDYLMMIGHFIRFHEANAETSLPHTPEPRGSSLYGGFSGRGLWSEDIECPRDCGDVLVDGECYTCPAGAVIDGQVMVGFDDFYESDESDAAVIDGEVVDGFSVIDNPTQSDHDALAGALENYYGRRLRSSEQVG